MKLILNGISKSYGATKALRHFSAELEPGIYALLGPNGSGKSTLMNLIAGNLKADGGEITYAEGESAPENILKMGARFREKLGFMPQYPGMYPSFTATQFLWYMAALKDVGGGLRGREKRAYTASQIGEVLRAVELEEVQNRRIGALSGGMKQRLCLAQAVLGDPLVLLLDEPTAGLDPKQRVTVRNYVARIAERKIVLLATHVVSDVEYIAREVILLKEGVIVDRAPPQELTRKLDGKVWLLPSGGEEIADLRRRFRVTSLTRDEETGGALLRVLSEERPDPAARSAAPTLEDFYLYVFGENGQNG